MSCIGYLSSTFILTVSRLLSYSMNIRLKANYFFKCWKLRTYTYLNNTKSQLGYIFMNRKGINIALNGEVYTYFEGVFFDHWIIWKKDKLESLKKHIVKTTEYDWLLLTNGVMIKQYTTTIRNPILFRGYLNHILRIRVTYSLFPLVWKQLKSIY